MIQPESKLPWSFIDDVSECSIKDANDYTISNDRNFEGFGLSGKDAQYVVQVANQYPILLEALERIESTTTDKETAKLIKQVLIEQGLWK